MNEVRGLSRSGPQLFEFRTFVTLDECGQNHRRPRAIRCRAPCQKAKNNAAALPKLPGSGANVGPSTSARSCPSVAGPRTPSQTTGSTMKSMPAIAALANMARGTSRLGSRSSRGHRRPHPQTPGRRSRSDRGQPSVTSPNQPGKGEVSVKVVASRQSTWPVRMGMRDERNASEAEARRLGSRGV
jgi:hypothetical protein